MATMIDIRRPLHAGAEGVSIRHANNSEIRNAAVAAGDKLLFPQA